MFQVIVKHVTACVFVVNAASAFLSIKIYQNHKLMKSFCSILAVLSLIVSAGTAKGYDCGNKKIHFDACPMDESMSKQDPFTYSFYDTLRSGNIEQTLESMLNPAEINTVVLTLEMLQYEVLEGATWLLNVQDLTTEEWNNISPLFFTAKRYFYSRELGVPEILALKAILEVLDLLVPMLTLTHACEILYTNNAPLSIAIKRQIRTLSETLACDTTRVCSEISCGTNWYGGARTCFIGQQLPLYLLSSEVYHSSYFKEGE